MNNASIIAQLQAIGPLPDSSSIKADLFPFDKFDKLIQKLEEPLAATHALSLINLGPPVDTDALEVEWALVNAVEMISITELRLILFQAEDTEVKQILEIRLANS